MKYITILFIILWTLPVLAVENIAQYLQDVSVTIKSNGSSGSGVIITREVQVSDEDETKEIINFVLTAAHVVAGLRSVRVIIEDGKEKKIVEFKDASLIKQLVEDGRNVGNLEINCKILKYSEADNGEDLALLIVRKRNFVTSSTKFYIDNNMILPIGTSLYHVGSMFGESGANSMTDGILSQVGHVLNLGSGDGVIMDRVSVVAWPGSSGGGVFLTKDGKYMGMLVRGIGGNFNMVVPIRRIIKWAKTNDIEWVFNSNLSIPHLKNIMNMKIEN